MIGPAVDEAASYERNAEDAFLWLSPKAKSVMDWLFGFDFDTHRIPVVRDYPVPMKGGHGLRTFVVDPLWIHDANMDERKTTVGRILETFVPETVHIVMKRQHTEAFLRNLMNRESAPR